MVIIVDIWFYFGLDEPRIQQHIECKSLLSIKSLDIKPYSGRIHLLLCVLGKNMSLSLII